MTNQMPALLAYVWIGDASQVRAYFNQGNSDAVDPETGMNALHIAVGRNNIEITKILIQYGVPFIPDNEGRMPSVIAAEMEVSDELADYIYEAEAAHCRDKSKRTCKRSPFAERDRFQSTNWSASSTEKITIYRLEY